MRNASLVGPFTRDHRPTAASHAPRGSGRRRRVATALALALLDAGCGSDDVRSPTAPTAPDPVVRTLVGIEIVNVPPAGLVVGYSVRLEVHGTYSDGHAEHRGRRMDVEPSRGGRDRRGGRRPGSRCTGLERRRPQADRPDARPTSPPDGSCSRFSLALISPRRSAGIPLRLRDGPRSAAMLV